MGLSNRRFIDWNSTGRLSIPGLLFTGPCCENVTDDSSNDWRQAGNSTVVRRETGRRLTVRVHYGEGVAIHTGPKSCAVRL